MGWARIPAIILVIFSLVRLPLGTIFGLVILYFLLADSDTKRDFEARPTA